MRRTMLRPAVLLAAAGMVATVALIPVVASAQELPPGGTGATTACAPNGGSGTTCTNTYGGDTSWDPVNQVQTGNPPSVTVDQTSNLTFQKVHITWQNFTPSFNVAYQPGFGANLTEYAVGIYECKGTDPHLDQGAFHTSAPSGDCYTINDQKYATAGVVNAVQTFTSSNGTGEADFQVETSVQNTFLGCDSAHPCSIVVVPNWGGYQVKTDGTEVTAADCGNHNQDDHNLGNGLNLDTYLGYPCSWADRIVVPITFAQNAAQLCPAANNQFNVEGSPALEQAMNQWRPGWCTQVPGQQPVSFGYNSGVDEYQSRGDFLSSGQALTASTDAALVNQPASANAQSASARPFTYAPLAVTGISVVYYVDNQQTGAQINDLVLNARLVAKLLTQSYALQYGQCTTDVTHQQEYCDPAVLGNPFSIFSDPEFLALNSANHTAADFYNWNSQDALPTFLPTVLAGNSDLTHELTAWIWSDPSARAFLQGEADPWGMHVNSYYETIGYPISQFLPQDPGWTGLPPGSTGAPNESMQLSWNPVSGLDNVVATISGNQASSLTNNGATCSVAGWAGGPCVGGNWVYPKATANPQNIGGRALFAIVDQANAAAFRFPTAKLVNAGGNAVAPTTESMSAAVNDMLTNPDKITQYEDFANRDPNAYPLTAVQYAMVPTCQLDRPTAQAVAAFLNDASSGNAQLYGSALGQLPAFGGYLALNDAQKAQAATAAAAVNSQTCASPPPDNTVGGQTASTVAAASPNPNNPANNAGPTPNNSPSSAATPKAQTSPSSAQSPIPLGLRSLDLNGFGAWALPIALGVGGLLAIAAGVTYLLTGTSMGRGLLRRLRGSPSLPGPQNSGDAE